MGKAARRATLALALGAVGCQAPGAVLPPVSPPAGAAAPKAAVDTTFIDQAGVKHRLSEFKGKFIVLTGWAEWCSHCQVHLPKMQSELYRPYAGKGIAFVNVEVSQGTAADVAAFASKLGITMPLYYDDNGSTRTAYPVKGYPNTTFISPDFRILDSKTGEMPIPDYIALFTPYLAR
jgi:peroxiredoxin